MNLTSPCVPWYFPQNDTSGTRICDPWEARLFRQKMDEIPENQCHCLTDCSTTLYHATVSAAPFRKCNFKNLGVSYLCDFDETLNPPIWGQQVLDQYMDDINQIPNYIKETGHIKSNRREYAGKIFNSYFSFKSELNNFILTFYRL